ncbi:hypothetical protein BCR44DRAFT_1440215 [Catenaria anguillulae PL171]|uniref:Uncharacterized protein n=1 Tax=Catenaria anguillulae PL171 TaxID=765915 RepID=A0A1Y2HEW9_9FUNG|nr:hypothetical protein BCR44DRAFT_1440215 [Catenaria anguillulae PL171]
MTLGHHVIVSYLSASQGASKTAPGAGAPGNRVGRGCSGGMVGHADVSSMDAKLTPRTQLMTAAATKAAGGGRPFSSITAESVHSESRPMFLYFLVISVIVAILASHSAILGVEAAGRRSFHCSECL